MRNGTKTNWLMLVTLASAGAILVAACGSDPEGTDDTDAGTSPDSGGGTADTGTPTPTPVDSGREAEASTDAGPTCTPAQTLCAGTCVDTSNDNANCGACGVACTDGKVCTGGGDAGAPSCQPVCTAPQQNCGGTCQNTQTSNAHCGACNAACGATEACGAGVCAVLAVGNGSDGAFAPAADETINQVRAGGAAGAAGQRVVAVADVTGFAAGQLVLVHQTRGANAGKYEQATIASIDANAKTLTMLRNLANTYASAGDVDRAQVVRVHQYTTVNVAAGVTVTAPAWDGTSGGILAFKATGAVTVAGNVSMDAKGFRGFSHAGTCAGGTRFACAAADQANGFSGESATGPSLSGTAANGAGGGGGQDGQDCAAGGGGSYGPGSTAGADGSVGGACRAGAQLGGLAGGEAGGADLNASLFFGGAGGEGGGDEDGAYPGAGGNGGGIVRIEGASLALTGSITSRGGDGAGGVQNAPGCGGGGCGMGGGGGGAGGAIHVKTTGAADVGADLVSAAGGTGGACTCGGSPGGVAGVGRVGVKATAVTGSTLPAFDAN